ncbi:MAG: hypothetical protein GQ574_00470 [Crocinitomix sp.]|nr:hypothetical protein [Crocinitomix sp.]
MIINQKGLVVALALAIASCTNSSDSNLNENSVDPLVDSVVAISNPEMIDAVDAIDTNAVSIDRDVNCEAHFRAAMNLPKPERLIIVHCDYWSSDHPIWLEHAFSFELEADSAFFQELIEHNGMIKYHDKHGIISQEPDWYLPKDVENYEGYYAEDDFDDFEIFRDLKSGHIFIRGSQY